MSTRVDLTPMVDLAFLLITFFMLTTTLNKPQAMELNMPKKVEQPEEQTDVADCQVMNILLDTLDQVWYYEGLSVAGLQKTTFAGDGGIRKEILKKQKELVKSGTCVYPAGNKRAGQPRDFIVLIKMLKGARYDNMVNILDEMDITGTKIYAIQAPDPIEIEAIDNGGVVKNFAAQ
ncbi:MAG: biopolymer transporter ExbD [Chitinophagales bacterium]|nr:biopolymer transporter ExbD [Chitinophagales bacterium]HRN93884.1 biopolymer transporter ExbD [Chitinophagales bacterium]HRP39605.1 biopolymer transporter ExbD [Chitinophagales bacterium]